RRCRRAVTLDELPRPVGSGRRAGEDGESVEVAPEVVGEGFGAGVAPGRVLRERLPHDRVEVAPELRGAGLVGDGGRLRRDRLADDPFDLSRGAAGEVVRAAAGEELEEEH